ncbi:MAG TPA: phage tail protein [Kofleriaceae bacterium]|jgi:phage tail-like protein|nr:phage tail protein [Kofleriaceae bacterium]
MAGSSNGTTRKDPLPAYVFQVKIGGTASAFFKSAAGLSYEMEAVPLKEGGVNNTTWQLVGAVKWKNITLKRGFSKDSDILKWRKEWMEGTMERKNVDIIQLDSQLNVVQTWTAKDCMPLKWELSEFDASKNEVAIETLELAHHGLTIS